MRQRIVHLVIAACSMAALAGSAGCLDAYDGGPGGSVASDPGAVTLHRLNRTEYNNTVRDLLGDTTHPADQFPPDNVGSTFDNNADVLSLAPVLLEDYATAAESLVTTALAQGSARRDQLLSCDPTTLGADACLRKIASDFARRAWRRPTTGDEIDRLVALAGNVDPADGFEAGVALALQGVLVDPNFLFRVELDPDPMSTTPHKLSPYELAARLSYYLYSSMPDDALSAAADAGQLATPDQVAAQVTRMLADPKADALVESFSGQWLFTRGLANAKPTPSQFPTFDEPLRQAMATETQLFVKEFLTADHDFTEMVSTDFTFLNDRLAQHYGIDGVTGSDFRKVSIGASPRGAGLLAQASILTTTSTPTRPSLPRRGKFVLSELLCQPPPDPPPGTPQLTNTTMPGMTARQQLEALTNASPVCASCHKNLNPLGGGLEHFDAIGAFRTTDNQLPIDATGTLPDGTKFDGAIEEAQVLKANPALRHCVAEKMFTYALGRELTAMDAPVLDKLVTDIGGRGNHLKDLIAQIVTQDAFAARRGGAK